MAQVGFGLSTPESLANDPITFGLTGGSVAAPQATGTPVPAATQDQIPGAPPPPPPAPPEAPAPQGAPQGQKKPLIDFDENPIGAIGLILQEVSAGMRGIEGPVAKKRKEQIEQQALKLRTTAATIDAVKTFGELSKDIPKAQMGAAIDQFEQTVGLPGVGDLLRATQSKGVDVTQLTQALETIPEAGPFLSTMLREGLMTPEDAIDFTTEFLGDRLKAKTEVDKEVAKQEALAPGEQVRTLTPEEAQAAGFPPGTVVQERPDGGFDVKFEPSSDDDTRTQKIANLVPQIMERDNLSLADARTKAANIVDGNIRIEIVPNLGLAREVNEVTGEVREIQIDPDQDGAGGQTKRSRTPVLSDVSRFGGTAPVGEAVEKFTFGAFGSNEERNQQRQRYRILRETVVDAFSRSGRPSNFAQQRVEELLPSSGVFESPARAFDQLSTMHETLQDNVAEDRQIAANPNLPQKERAEAQGRILKAERAMAMIGDPTKFPRPGSLPEGIPEGSRLIGTTKSGAPVYETPDAQRLVVE